MSDDSKVHRSAEPVEAPVGEDIAVKHTTEVGVEPGVRVVAVSAEPTSDEDVAKLEQLARDFRDQVRRGGDTPRDGK
jgi:hypothetical protein